ncbi:MAG: DUF4194 domain-containing protein [Dethiobacteria bacterium]|jgi:hypothetical protein
MSSFEELHTELTDKEKQLFSETVNLLLARTYLVYERQEDRRHYRFVEKHLELFRRYLEIARWSIHLVKQYGVIQCYNMDERNRRNFTLQETIFLFILRLLYDEKRRDLRLTQQVLVTGQEIQEKYLALQIKNRLPAREVMQRILKMFSSFSLLDLKRGHWREPDAVYELYPSLLLVLSTGDLESLADWLKERADTVGTGIDADDDSYVLEAETDAIDDVNYEKDEEDEGEKAGAGAEIVKKAAAAEEEDEDEDDDDDDDNDDDDEIESL